MPKKLLLTAAFACLLINNSTAKSFDVPIGIEWIRQINSMPIGQSSVSYNSMSLNAQAGDTLNIIGGTRTPMRVDNLRGDSLNPIIICNKNSQVIITKPVGGYFGLSFNACRYIKVSGKNNASLPYGILITKLPSGSALSINNFSSNFEVEGVEVSRVFSSGIVAKTDPNCANVLAYTSFVMYDLKFHHNYIHHVGNEGFYIGNTSYNDGVGSRLSCTTPPFVGFILPHKIIGVSVYENIVDSTGWDGIQVAASENLAVYDNYISYDSYADVMNQQSGILIGQPSQGNVYRNIIVNGKGSGIQCFGIGNKIYNNVIVNPGNSTLVRGTFNSSGVLINSTFSYGIYINDKVCKDINVPKLPYLVANNTVVVNKIYRVGAPYNTWAPQGINANALNHINGSYIANNLVTVDSNLANVISNPINGIYASNSVPNYSTAFSPSFISCNSRSTLANNYYSNEIQAVQFANISANNYSLLSTSGAVNTGIGSAVTNNPVLNKDILNITRPQGSMPDFGAYELQTVINNAGFSGITVVPNPISLSLNSAGAFTVVLNDTAVLLNLNVKLVGGYQAGFSQLLSVQTDQIVNGKRVLTIAVGQLPYQPGVYSIQVLDSVILKAFANLLLIP